MEITIVLLNCQSKVIKLESHERTGKHLINRIFSLLELEEYRRYFGLSFRDKEDGERNWLSDQDDLSSVLGRVKSLQFGVRFYPTNPESEITDDKALELFCLHLKELLVRGELACDVDTHAYLDGLLVQAISGDYRASKHGSGYLKRVCGVEICAPTFLNSNCDVKESHYLRAVCLNHRRNLGITANDAYRMFVSRVRQLPYFGFTLHKAKDNNRNTITLGLAAKGLTVISDKVIDRLETPKECIFYHWSGLRYCERARGKVLFGFETDQGTVTELRYKVKSKNSFCGAERLKKDVFGYRDVFAKEDSDFYTSRRRAHKSSGMQFPDRKTSRHVPFVRLHSISESLRRSFKMKKPARARFKRGSDGDITSSHTRESDVNETFTSIAPSSTTHADIINISQQPLQ